ncbi:hypothetical protein DM02DRAFT_701928 [Periconia macrospinosa]|uniref:Zn(2)-C6 fungal-type domain-containing protein n=1 Tax=Periconia macrospinosa TaxID=97972 RepID=A0A2V1DZU4_9PLEO|nr:hypothetical protein DM02DRAFT_701928 [Periconia macrospinosa]
MAPDEVKKRKACQSCIRAKAKCSPSTDQSDICYRCQRLKKECVFEETVRKRGPKSRSRVKQLEQRVDSLIGLLAANGQSLEVTENIKSEPFEAYDPIEAGLISEHAASKLVDEFKQSFVVSFPFVVIPPSTDVNTLRKHSPFLFLAVLTVTSYRTPELQLELANQLKSQIAIRIIEHSHKSLEILQGLLVYGSWYHFFYRPANQQLAVVIQLCVAIVQDLALSKNPKENTKKPKSIDDPLAAPPSMDRGSAGERAYLGTYYLGAAFSQAWRKRVTIQYTRYMAQCCRNVASRQEYPSDVLILPLIQLSELMCRINDIFSYDDIENADVKGDMMLDMSITNFSSELDRIQDAVAPSVRQNTTLDLQFRLLRIWIHECALHSSFWTPSPTNSFSISPTRLKALRRCLRAMQSYVDKLLLVPQSSLHHLSSSSWVGWFYAVIVACKLEVTKLMTDEFDTDAPQESYSLPTNVVTNASWDAIVVAQEANVQTLFEGFLKKLDFTVAKHPTDECECSDPLHSLLYLQRTLSHGFMKRMKEQLAKASAESNSTRYRPSTYQANTHATNNALGQYQHTETHTQTDSHSAVLQNNPLQMLNNNFNFNSLNFDGFMMPESHQTVQYDDMLWDMVMDDFSMPPL